MDGIVGAARVYMVEGQWVGRGFTRSRVSRRGEGFNGDGDSRYGEVLQTAKHHLHESNMRPAQRKTISKCTSTK